MSKQKDFDMNLLRVFVSVCQTGSFTKASEELDLTQSSVSNAIRRLKKALGNELFTRSGRGIEMTAFGKHFFESVEPSVMSLVNTIGRDDRFEPLTSSRNFIVYALESALPRLHFPTRTTSIHMIWSIKAQSNSANQWLRELIIAAERD
ncbi:LysR family transcriptional regulator [Aliivibrio fischeri]|uniref:LysR family transcriptional regulator n=1 Tax=Aliivibrio fischeri TaxID=668 RepID=UPI0007C540A0